MRSRTLIDQLKKKEDLRPSDPVNNLMKLPPDIQNEIKKYLPLEALQNLSKCSVGLFSRCADDLNKANATLMEELTQSVIDDDAQAIKNILDTHPDLLALDPKKLGAKPVQSQLTWQTFQDHPFVLALVRGQVRTAKLLLSYFEKIEDGKVLAEKMWAHADKLREKQIQKSKDYNFKGLIDVIANETFPNGTEICAPTVNGDFFITQFSDKTEGALAAFRKAVLLDEAVSCDYYDINELLKAAREARGRHFSTFKGVNASRQCAIFCVKVFGFIQSLLPREDAEAWCEGFYDVVENLQEINDSARALKLDGGEDFYRPGSSTRAGLGYEYCVWSEPARGGVRGGLWKGGLLGGVEDGCMKHFVKQKQQKLEELRSNTLSSELHP